MFDFSLKVFLTVAKLNSFTRAAEFLNLSQPAVTHQIKNLESLFGTRLFHRDQNRIELTRSGQALLKYAENIDLLYQKAMQEILEITHQVAGDIHLGAASLLGKYLLPRILGNFKKTYPDVNLSMLVGNSKEILESLENGIIELAIMSEPIPSRNLVAPAFIMLKVPDYAAHMFVFYYAILSEVSPPTALSPFAAAAICKGNPYKTTLYAWKYTLPAFLVPFTFTIHPKGVGLLLKGSALDIVTTFATALLGVLALAGGVDSWFFKRTTILERVLLIIAGLALMYPAGWADILGIVLVGIVILSQKLRKDTP